MTMTAARLKGGSLAIETVAIPEPSPSEVRIRVAYAGICLSDIHFLSGEYAAGMLKEVTLGHEVSGVVDAVGEGVTGWSPGDRVLAEPLEDFGTHARIMGVNYDGAWAEYVLAPSASLVDLGPDLPFDVAAIIPDAVATPWAAITDTGRVRPAESVGVWGLGGLGFHAVKLLRLIGAAPIVAIDPLPAARERALRAGADVALDPLSEDFESETSRITGGRGLDVAFDFFGSPRIHQQAFDAIGRGGRLVLTGIPATPLSFASASDLIRHSKRIIGHYGQSVHHCRELVSLIAHGRLDLTDSISAVHALQDARVAIDQVISKDGDPIRVLLQP